MAFVKTKDGVDIFYKDWGKGQPIVFSHGWPLSADDWDMPVPVMHGDDDQSVPYADSAPLSVELRENATLKTYQGFPHGMPTTQAETSNADLLDFIRS